MNVPRLKHTLFMVLMAAALAVTFNSCEDEIIATRIMMVSVDPAKITENSADVVGEILQMSSLDHGDYGFIYNIDGEPNFTDEKSTYVSLGSNPGKGKFSGSLTSLIPNTIYYVRAYVEVGNEICYSPQMRFQTKESSGNYTFFLNETFDNNDNSWYEAEEDYGSFSVEDGSYNIMYSREGYFKYVHNEFDGLQKFMSSGTRYMQVGFAAESATDATDQYRFGFIWNVVNGESFEYLILEGENGVYKLYIGSYTTDGFSTLESLDASSYLVTEDNMMAGIIVLEVENNKQTTVYLNSNELYTMSTGITKDRVGFYLSNANALADDLLLYKSNSYAKQGSEVSEFVKQKLSELQLAK